MTGDPALDLAPEDPQSLKFKPSASGKDFLGDLGHQRHRVIASRRGNHLPAPSHHGNEAGFRAGVRCQGHLAMEDGPDRWTILLKSPEACSGPTADAEGPK